MSKNNKLLMIGGGLVALGGAYWAYRRANLPDDIPTSRIPVGASSYGDDSLPVDMSRGSDHWDNVKAHEPPYTFSPATMYHEKRGIQLIDSMQQALGLPTGRLKIVVQQPKAKVGYDAKAYQGTRLAAMIKPGQTIDRRQADKILRYQAFDSPGAAVKNADGSWPEYVWRRRAVYYKKIEANDPATFLFSAKAPYPMSRDWSEVEETLLRYGFTKITDPAETDRQGTGEYTSGYVSPGKYMVIAQAPASFHTMQWLYPKGFWKWTADGPVAKENCSYMWDRLNSPKNMTKCDEELQWATKFSRVIAGAGMWGDISTTVEVKHKSVGYATISPKALLMITDRKYVKSNLANAMVWVCRGKKMIESVGKANPKVAAAMKLMEKGSCSMYDMFSK